MLTAALEDNHKDLYQWFLLHQECLLIADDEKARQAYKAFDDFLRQHIQFENEYLLSDLASTDFSQLRWQPNVYLKEHDKVLDLLTNVQVMLHQYFEAKGRIKRLLLLELLEWEGRMRHVIEHHEQREEQDLFLHIADQHEQWFNLYEPLRLQHEPLRQVLKALLQDS